MEWLAPAHPRRSAATTMSDKCEQILASLRLSEALKRELRHSWLSDGRRESVAEHTWNMALLAMLCHPHLEHPVNLEKTLKMVLVHDLVEAEAGDIPFFEESERQNSKQASEVAAMKKISAVLPSPANSEISSLWHEFEAFESLEAKFVKALDNLEVQIQHNWADLSTWEPIEFDLVYTKMDKHCAHDAFLKTLCGAVKNAAETKLRKGGINVDEVKARTAGTAAEQIFPADASTRR